MAAAPRRREEGVKPSSLPLSARSAATNEVAEPFTTSSPSSSPLARGPLCSTSSTSSPTQDGGMAAPPRNTAVLQFAGLEHEDLESPMRKKDGEREAQP